VADVVVPVGAGAVVIDDSRVEVVVVVVSGVAHEAKANATTGRRMISFFIICWLVVSAIRG
jgi:hypothetical protein